MVKTPCIIVNTLHQGGGGDEEDDDNNKNNNTPLKWGVKLGQSP
jgi:hypothetical protein